MKKTINGLDFGNIVERDALPEGADLEAVIRNEIQYLEARHSACAEAADSYRMQANAYKDKMRAAGLKV